MAANSDKPLPSSQSLQERLYRRLSAERAKADLERIDRMTQHGALGIVRAAIIGFNNHNDTLWASALTFTLSLSVVPILAVALSAVQALIGTGWLRPLIKQYLAINSPQVTDKIMQFVGRINVTTVGVVGGATLLVTVVLTLGTIEQTLNAIFNVAQSRTWIRKFTDYLSITCTVPVLLAVALPIKTAFQARLPQFAGLGWIVATIPIWIGFSFLYIFFPNRNVRWDCAALGGLVAAVLFQIGNWVYIRFQLGAASYQAIYGALAAVPILLTWIYIAWTIVLAGAELTAAAQGTEASFSLDYRSPAFFRTALLLTVFRAGERALARQASACTVHSLAAELGAPSHVMREILDRLEAAGIILEVEKSGHPSAEGIFLARDSSELTLAELFATFERPPEGKHGDPRVTSVLKTLAATEHEAFSAVTVRDLVNGRFGQRLPTEPG